MSTLKPDLTRVWANSAPPANVVDPDTTTPGKVSSGWQAEVPPFEHFNFLQKWFTQGLAHFNEQGIGVWDTDTTYPVDGLVKGSDGNIYVALTEQNGNDPVSDSGSNWVLYQYSNKVIIPQGFVAKSIQELTVVTGTIVNQKAFLSAGGRSGEFYWATVSEIPDLVSKITNDPNNIMYFAPDSDPTGSSGAWVRIVEYEFNIEWAGASEFSADNKSELQAMADFLEAQFDGGLMYIPPKKYDYSGDLQLKSRVGIRGSGFASILHNTSTSGTRALMYSGTGSDTTSTDRVIGQMLKDLTLSGNSLSGDGLVVRLSGATDNGVLDRKPTVPAFNHIKIINHGGDGVVIGNSASFGAGNLFPFDKCQIAYNGGRGVYVQGQSNLANLNNCLVHNNGSHGVYLNFITSTCSFIGTLFMDNGGWGIFCFSAEEPLVMFCGFNRNSSGSIALSGNATKYTEAAVIMGNLFGDNGSGAATAREVSLNYAKGSTVRANYFYGTGQDSMVYISDYVEGADISGNHYKDLTTEDKLEIKVGVVGSFYTFRDDQRPDAISRIITNQVVENVLTSNLTVFRNRADGNPSDFFNLKSSGEMNWGDGNNPTDVSISRQVAGSLRCTGGFEASTLMVEDGISEPSARSGYARMFVDSIDGDLKIKFSDGTVKTIVTDS